MTTQKIKLGIDVLDIELTLQYASAQSFGLQVSNADNTPADLTGSTATLEFDDDAGTVLTADTSGDVWQWNLDASETTLEWGQQEVVLWATLAGVRRVWGRGKAMVER